MHYIPHALLHCVAWLSLLSCGNAARGASPSEVLTHFAHTVGTVLAPSLASEVHAARQNRSSPPAKEKPKRRQTDESQAPVTGEPREAPVAPGPAAAAPGAGAVGVGGVSSFPGPGVPFQYERTYQYRYPAINEQLSRDFYPGSGFGNNQLLNGGVPFDPRLFQAQIGAQRLQLAPGDGGVKPLETRLNANANIVKESGSSANLIQSLDAGAAGGGDSKSSAQSRPYEGTDFATLPQGGIGGGAGQGVGGGVGGGDRYGNVRVDNRFSTLGYERVRQNYYGDPSIDQRNYFSPSFNEIPFGGGAGFRSPLGDRYSSLEYGGRGGIGPNSDLRSSNGLSGLGDPYFGNFFQGPYQSLNNFNSLPGGGGGGIGGSIGGSIGGGIGGGVGGASDGSGPGFDNVRFGPGGGNFQYPANGGGGGISPYFQDGDGASFGGADSSLRASSAKETVAPTDTRRQDEARPEESTGQDKVNFVAAADKTEKPAESGQA